MAKVKGAAFLFILLSGFYCSFAQEISNLPEQRKLSKSGGQSRKLKGVLGGLILKRILRRKVVKGVVALALGAALILKAKLILLKLKALGLAVLLSHAGIEEPEDVVEEMDLGSACNVALDLGISCTEMVEDEPYEVQEAVHQMYHVLYYVEEEKAPPPPTTYIHYVSCEAEEKKPGKIEYYVVKDSGEKTPYTPASGDAPVEYVIVNEDGSTEPYHGPVDVIVEEETPEHPEEGEVVYEVKTHSPRKRDPTIKVTVPKGVETTTPEEIAVDTTVQGKKTEYVRYKPQRNAEVYDSEALAAFKMRLLENISEAPEFEERDGIYVARMLRA